MSEKTPTYTLCVDCPHHSLDIPDLLRDYFDKYGYTPTDHPCHRHPDRPCEGARRDRAVLANRHPLPTVTSE